MIRGLREKLGLADDERLSPQVQMGIALAATKRTGETYAGTVPFSEKQRRRSAGRQAKASRRINRGRR